MQNKDLPTKKEFYSSFKPFMDSQDVFASTTPQVVVYCTGP